VWAITGENQTFCDMDPASAPTPPKNNRLNHSPKPEKYLPSTKAGGLAVFDFDNDGLVDVFLRMKPGCRRCANPVQSTGTGFPAIAAADTDGHGWPDIFVTNDTDPTICFGTAATADSRKERWSSGLRSTSRAKPCQARRS
jgi:hypothetical protein